MGKLTGSQRDALIEGLLGGEKSSELQKQYNVSKTTINAYRREIQKVKKEDGPDIRQSDVKLEREEKIEEPILQSKVSAVDSFYDPVNVREFIEEEAVTESNEKHMTIPKSLLNAATKKLKQENVIKPKKAKKETVKDEPEVEIIDEDIEKVKLKIRQYAFAFESDTRVREYVGNDINRFNLSLSKKSLEELNRILSYMRFLIKSSSNTDKVIETTLMTTMIVIEKIGSKVGLQLDGLSKEIGDDLKNETSDLKRTIMEIGIEMDISKYFQNPKVDLILNVSKKLLFVHSKNKALNQLKPSEGLPPPQPVQNVTTYLKSGLDEELKDKYQDL